MRSRVLAPLRRLAGLALAGLAGAVLSGASAAPVAGETPPPGGGIGVAPFAVVGGAPVPDVASRLADELARLSPTRVVTPGSLRHDGGGPGAPEAADIRRWASANAVDSVVVGRAERGPRGGLDVSVELCSGHSGVPRAEYHLRPGSQEALPGAVDHLARLILADLGEQAEAEPEPLPDVSAPAPSVSATSPTGASAAGPTAAASPSHEGATDSSGEAAHGDVGLGRLPGVRKDEPIRIHSDELEVLPQNGGRRLVFTRNVVVLQGEIRLDADRLEAVYPQGASEPDLLVASGRVRVAEGDRRARCQNARYERVAATIVCRGEAEVFQGCDRVRGEKISFDLTSERVVVTGAASALIQPKSDDEAKVCPDGSAPVGKGAP